MNAAWLAIAAALIAGCAAEEKPEPKGPPAKVTIYREPSSRDSLFPMLFAVDGRPITQLDPGNGRIFEVQAGEHEFGYLLGVYNCTEKVWLESGKSYVYRLAQGCVIAREDDSVESPSSETAVTRDLSDSESRPESERPHNETRVR